MQIVVPQQSRCPTNWMAKQIHDNDITFFLSFSVSFTIDVYLRYFAAILTLEKCIVQINEIKSLNQFLTM